jgi:GDPmannose 4,6-dehydratase
VDALVGDASRAHARLGWSPKVSFATLVDEMVTADLALARREKASLGRGLKVFRPDLGER